MGFFVDRWPINDYAELERQYGCYREYLEGLRERLASSAFEFALAGWHYDHHDHRCLHDSWVEEIKIRENSEGERGHIRRLEISLLLFGASHDGTTELTYVDVQSYSIGLPSSASLRKTHVVHADWF